MRIQCVSKYNKRLEITVESGNTIANDTIYFEKNNKQLYLLIEDLKNSLYEAEFLLENGAQ